MHSDTGRSLRRRARCPGAYRSRSYRRPRCSFVVGSRLRLGGDLARDRPAGTHPGLDHDECRAMTTYGVMFRREWPANKLIEYARRVEAHDLDEMWVVEDLTF